MFHVCADAQQYPSRLIRIYASEAGSNVDLVARLVAQGLSATFGQQVIVENRNGLQIGRAHV